MNRKDRLKVLNLIFLLAGSIMIGVSCGPMVGWGVMFVGLACTNNF